MIVLRTPRGEVMIQDAALAEILNVIADEQFDEERPLKRSKPFEREPLIKKHKPLPVEEEDEEDD